MSPTPHPRDASATAWRAALRDRLIESGVRPAPDLSADDARRLDDIDALLAQMGRAARHSSGAVRAYASLVADAADGDADTAHWVSRIDRATGELDGFVRRLGALRVCRSERLSSVSWRDILDRVGARCDGIAPCRIEVIDRTAGGFRHRAELVSRATFHLVRNAMESSPRGACVRVRVDEGRLDGRRTVHLRVSDGGPDWEPTDEVWRPFVTTRPGHTGLGLAHVAACLPILGACAGFRRDAERTVVHLMLGEAGDIEWES
jgi:nitrogen-specific signal transduction histidine kinase